jgi:TIR domain
VSGGPQGFLFVSYTAADEAWATWIGAQLEAAGQRVRLQAWDSPAGENFVVWIGDQMQAAARTVTVCSEAYFSSHWCTQEWAGALAGRKVIPVRVAECDMPETLRTIGWRDLFGVGESEARQRLLEAAGLTAAARVPSGGFPDAAGMGSLGTGGLVLRLTPRPEHLAGRDGLLAELEGRLSGGPGPRVAVLCGLGGAGKTSVAVEYAHRQLGRVGMCWQLQAEDPAVLAAEFAELAVQLGVGESAGARDPVGAVHAVLARTQASWLLLFDNVADPEAVQRFLPPAGNGQVVITTQSQHWPPARALDVPALDSATAAGFLLERTGGTDRTAARELAGELGGLPLALEQAAAYMRAAGIPLEAYLRLFRDRQADLLARGEASGHRQHTAATLALAAGRLEQEAPAAAGLLQLLAFLAPEPVPLPLLLAGRDATPHLGTAAGTVAALLGDPLAAADAVAALRRYSLAASAGDGQVQVHRLVQATTRARLTADEQDQWRQAAAAVVGAAIPADPGLPGAWSACAALLPHARAVLSLTSTSMRTIAWALGLGGSYRAARDLFARIAAAQRESSEYGPEHPDTLAVLDGLAHYTGEAGDPVAARDQYTALLPITERIAGAEHRDTLSARAHVAYWTGHAGDVVAARDQYTALLPITERVAGAEEPLTLSVRSNIAYWSGHAGDAVAARDQYAALLPVGERVAGAEHSFALSVRSNIARWTGQAGDAAAARDQYAALVPISDRVFGAEHPDALVFRAELARWTGEAGDAAAARDQYAALLPVRERVLGAEHPETLSTRANLAIWTEKARAPASQA